MSYIPALRRASICNRNNIFLVNIFNCPIKLIQTMENTTETKTKNVIFNIPQPYNKNIIFVICFAMYILSFFVDIRFGDSNILYSVPIVVTLLSFQIMFFNNIREHLRNKFIFALSILILVSLSLLLKGVSYELSSSLFVMAMTLVIYMKKVFKN